ncbi:MAG: hypothetical protein C0608_08155 [Deltaproteobacteria bacterium]|nr:MAG: hypothetical protein C0608_08155 [Deltaproteobacteria bacterium]
MVKYSLTILLLVFSLSIPFAGATRAAEVGLHATISDTIEEWARATDAFFGGEVADYETTGTYLRTGIQWEARDHSTPMLSYDLNLHLRLPVAERRFNLFLQSEDTEEDEQLSDTLGAASDLAERSRESTFAGLGYIFTESEKWKSSIIGGVRLIDPPDPFVRFKLRRRQIELGTWHFRADQSVTWRNNSGFSEATNLWFDRPMENKVLFRANTFATWDEEDLEVFTGQTFNLMWRATDDLGLSALTGVLGETKPHWRETQYLLLFPVRYFLKGEWLIFGVRPGVRWPREYDFKPVREVQFRIEAYFDAERVKR